MDHRLQGLITWLASWLDVPVNHIAPKLILLAGDASFRKYYRLNFNNKHYVVMDAPPPQESCHSFVAIDQALAEIGLVVPVIFAADVQQGYAVLSDLGDDLYFKILNPQNAEQLYTRALDELVIMQTRQPIAGFNMGSYDDAMFSLEMQRVHEWFLTKYLKLDLTNAQNKMLDKTFRFLIDTALEQPVVFTHRDYHSRNLFWLPEKQVGIIDFQDSVWGPISYDAVSLLRDCYIDWPQELVVKLAHYFKEQTCRTQKLTISTEQFMRWFDLMGVQRHLKATYIFARKFCRDQQAEYLADVPRALHYVVNVAKHYPELRDLRDFILQTVQPTLEQIV